MAAFVILVSALKLHQARYKKYYMDMELSNGRVRNGSDYQTYSHGRMLDHYTNYSVNPPSGFRDAVLFHVRSSQDPDWDKYCTFLKSFEFMGTSQCPRNDAKQVKHVSI